MRHRMNIDRIESKLRKKAKGRQKTMQQLSYRQAEKCAEG